MNDKTESSRERRAYYRARRVLINGRFVSPNVKKHGTRTGYTYYSCRCVECSETYNNVDNKDTLKKNIAYYKSKRIMINGRLYSIECPEHKHGTTTGYDYYACRCLDCTHAKYPNFQA